MFRQVIGRSLAHPRLVAWACIWLAVVGLFYARNMQFDFLPAIGPGQAMVETEARGLVAQQVEATVTRPIEAVLLGTPGIARVESHSVQGLSVVTLKFARGVDPVQVREAVSQNLARVGALPAGVATPVLSPLLAPGPGLIKIGFSGGKNAIELRQIVQWLVRPRLLSTPGVARVAIRGGQIPQIAIRARPGDLSDSGLGFLDVVSAARRATSVAGAGFIDTPNQRVLIESHGQAETIDAVKDGQIQTPGNDPVRIDDVADVSEVAAPSYGDARISGQPAVIVAVDQGLGTNVLATTHAVEQTLDILRPSLSAQGITMRTDLDRPAGSISRLIDRIVWDLGIGAVLAALALLLILRDVRVVLVSLVSIPMTFLMTLAVLKLFGFTLNVMTLGGLAVSLGLVIDDAVIDVESVRSELIDTDGSIASRRAAILAASIKVRAPVFYATLALALALLPLLFLHGPEASLFVPLAWAIIVASLCSLLSAMTVTPALALMFFSHMHAQPRIASVERFKAWYSGLLRRTEASSGAIMGCAAVLVIVAVAVLLLFHSQLMPAVHDGHVVASFDAPVSTAPAAITATSEPMAKDIAAIPGVRTVSQQIGRDPTTGDQTEVEHSTLDIDLEPRLDDAAQSKVAGQVQRVLTGYGQDAVTTGSRFDFGDAIGHGVPTLRINVLGQDLDAVDETASKVVAVLARTPGGATVRTPSAQRGPIVRVDLNFNKLALSGLSASDVLETVQAAFAGEPVARIYQGSTVEDLVVVGQDSLRQDPETIGNLLLRSTSGLSVPLSSVANVYLTDGRAAIEHDGGAPRRIVTATPSSADIDGFARQARTLIERSVKLPRGVFLTYETANSAAETRANLSFAYGLGFFGVLTFLALAFDARTALLVLLSTGFAFIGAAIAVALMGGTLSIGSIAGLVALLGISMRHAIPMISEAEDLATEGALPWSFVTLTRSITDRSAPLTASAALVILVLAPLALGGEAAGMEILGPMAIVIIAGTVSGVIGDLIVLPMMLWKFWHPQLASIENLTRDQSV